MKTVNPFSHATEQFKDLAPEITLVVLHPDFYGQHSLLTPILLDSDATPIFLSVGERDTSLRALLELFEQSLNAQLGTHLTNLVQDKQPAGTVAQALRAHNPVTIVLDAYDQTRQDEVMPFIGSLAQTLSGGSRLILGGRVLPTGLLKREELQGKTAVVPVNPDKMMLDYVEAAQQTVLEVRALGPGRVLINGRLIEQWDCVLPRTLFF